MNAKDKESLEAYRALSDSELMQLTDEEFADFTKLEEMAADTTKPAAKTESKPEQKSVSSSRVVSAALSALPAMEQAIKSIPSQNPIAGIAGEFASPNITEYQNKSGKGDSFSQFVDPEYWKAAGKDVLRALPLLTAPFGGEAIAAMSVPMRVGASAGLGAAESGMYAVGENALNGEEQANPIDAMALGGILGGGLQGVGEAALKATPAARRVALDVMARRSNVSPEAIEAYSTKSGRQRLSNAFGSEYRLQNEMLDASGPSFMELMPESSRFNELVGEMKTPTNLGVFSKDLRYNPALKTGGVEMLTDEKAAAREISNLRALLLNEPGSAATPFRNATPSQLNDLRKRYGQEMDKSWQALEAGIPPAAEKAGKSIYRSIRGRLLEIAETEGMDEAKKLLADQARKMGARDEFINAWAGGSTNKQKAALKVRETIANVTNNPSIRKLDQMEKLRAFDDALGTDFARQVEDASYARQMAGKTATPGNYFPSFTSKHQTGAAGGSPFSVLANTVTGGSPATAAQATAAMRAFEQALQAGQGLKKPVPYMAYPLLQNEENRK